MADQRYDPKRIEPKWQELWAARAHVGGVQRRPTGADEREKSYVLEMLPYPSGEPHIGHLKNYALGRRDRALPPPDRPGGCCTRWATTPSGCRPRTTRSRPASIRASRPTSRSPPSGARSSRWGISIDWSRELATPRARVLPLDAVDLPEALRARARVPQGGGGQLVPERPDGARQRAGDRRPLRAVRRTRSRSASSSSGSSGSPTTPTACSTISTRSSGPSTSRRCSATGSAAATAPR